METNGGEWLDLRNSLSFLMVWIITLVLEIGCLPLCLCDSSLGTGCTEQATFLLGSSGQYLNAPLDQGISNVMKYSSVCHCGFLPFVVSQFSWLIYKFMPLYNTLLFIFIVCYTVQFFMQLILISDYQNMNLERLEVVFLQLRLQDLQETTYSFFSNFLIL